MCRAAEVDDGATSTYAIQVLFKSYDVSQARCLQVDRNKKNTGNSFV